jgi:hypothetical protein
LSEAPVNDEPKTFSEEYVKTLREENARRRLAEKTANEELARVRTALGIESEGSADAAKAAEKLRAQSEADREAAREALTRAEFVKASGELGFIDADAAWRLADLSAVRVDLRSRKVEGLREALDALVREKPFLVGRAARAGSPGGGTPRSSASQDDDSLAGRIRRQFERRLPRGLSAPGAGAGNLRMTR